MNTCEALSLTGEREVLATAIYLLNQALDSNTGTYATTLKNIYEIFIQNADLLQTFDATSGRPASAVAIAAYVANELAAYRLSSVPIEIAEVNGLLAFLSNYRLLTNQAFTAITTDTLSFKENNTATDLATKIAALETRIGNDELDMGRLATILGGENFMATEESHASFIGKTMKELLASSVFQAGTHAQNYKAANDWSLHYTLPNHYYSHPRSTSRSFDGALPDTTWAMPGGNDVYMRYVFRRKTLVSSPLNLVNIPASDNVNFDMGHVYECDQELRSAVVDGTRQYASFLLGKEGTDWEGKFRVAHIGLYDGNFAASFPNQPVHNFPGHQTELFTITKHAANFHVPVFYNGTQLGGGSTVNKTFHTTNVHQDQHTHIKRIHRHTHNHIHDGDRFETYIAPSRTVINRYQLHNLNSYNDFTNLQTINRIYKSVKTIPNFLHTDFTQIVTRQNWNSITGKPDFASLFASPSYVDAAVATKIGDSELQTALQSYVSSSDLTTALNPYATTTAMTTAIANADYAATGHNHHADYAFRDHNHDERYMTIDGVSVLVGQRVHQTQYDSAIGSINATLGTKANTSALGNYYLKSETYNQTTINEAIGDKITLAGLNFTLLNYVTTNNPNYLKTDTDMVLHTQQAFSDGLRVKWRYQGSDEDVILLNLATHQALEARVASLESFTVGQSTIIQTMENALNTVTQQASATQQTVDNLFAFLTS